MKYLMAGLLFASFSSFGANEFIENVSNVEVSTTNCKLEMCLVIKINGKIEFQDNMGFTFVPILTMSNYVATLNKAAYFDGVLQASQKYNSKVKIYKGKDGYAWMEAVDPKAKQETFLYYNYRGYDSSKPIESISSRYVTILNYCKDNQHLINITLGLTADDHYVDTVFDSEEKCNANYNEIDEVLRNNNLVKIRPETNRIVILPVAPSEAKSDKVSTTPKREIATEHSKKMSQH